MMEGKASCGFEAAEVASLVTDLRGVAAAADESNGAYLFWWKQHGGGGC
jgi:hypothetical protein